MNKILIIDFGSQYTQLIARRVRELSVYCEIIPYDAKIEKISAFCPNGIILSGGPNSVYENETPNVSPAVFELEDSYFRYLLWHADNGKSIRWRSCQQQ